MKNRGEQKNFSFGQLQVYENMCFSIFFEILPSSKFLMGQNFSNQSILIWNTLSSHYLH